MEIVAVTVTDYIACFLLGFGGFMFVFATIMRIKQNRQKEKESRLD